MRTYLSLCSGVNDGWVLSRSSISIKSFPKPSYLANSIILDEEEDDMRLLLLLLLLDEEIVEKAFAMMGRTKERTLKSSVMLAIVEWM